MLELPVRSDFKAYEFQIDLDGIVYTLRFRFNYRMERWVMDIATEAGEDILNGIVLVTGYPLLDQYAYSELPPGRMIAIDVTGQNRDAGEDDLGNSIKLLYEEVTA